MENLNVSSSGAVMLELPAGKMYKRRRCLGHLIGDTFITERDASSIMRVFGGSVGFNQEFVRRYRFQTVIVVLPSQRLYTTRQTIITFGRYLYFKDHLLERQIFLSIADFGRIPSYSEPAPPFQGDLFDTGTQYPIS